MGLAKRPVFWSAAVVSPALPRRRKVDYRLYAVPGEERKTGLRPMADSTFPSADAAVFHLPSGLRYECVRDGDCCRDYDIVVEPEDVERIEAAEWRACSRLAPGAASPCTVLPRQEGQRSAFVRLSGACNFLTGDGGCGLHERYGRAIKAHACRRFPYSFVEAPDGVYVGLSFGCRSIQKNAGRPVEEQFDDVREEFLRWPAYHRVAEPVRFDATTPITWPDYLAIESSLDEILGREDRPFGQCLIAGHAWLGMLRRMLHATKKPSDPGVSQIVAFYLERTRTEGFARAFRIAERSVASRATKRMLLGSFVLFRTAALRGGSRFVVAARLLLENVRHWLRLGSFRFPPFEEAISWRKFRPDPAALNTPEAQTLLRRYFRHALFRKDAIRHTDLFWGYCYLVLAYGLIEWHLAAWRVATRRSEALRGEPVGGADPAPGRGGDDASHADNLRQAVNLVERFYLHHSNFNQLFLYHPAVAETVQYLFKRPNFAHSIVAG